MRIYWDIDVGEFDSMVLFVRSDVVFKGYGVVGFIKKVIFGVFVLCVCIIVLF